VAEDRRWRGYAMVVGACLCWGTMAVLAKLLFRDRGVAPLTLVAARFYLATLTLVVVLAVALPRRLRIGWSDWWAAAAVGVGGLVTNNFLYFLTIHLTSVATALLLQYQAPILVALYAILIQRQRLSRRLLLALGLGILGCGLVVGVYDPAVLRPNLLGIATGLGTACAFAYYILASRAALRRMDSWTLLAYAYLAGSLIWAAILPPWALPARVPDPSVWWAFIAVATLGTVIPFGLFIRALTVLPATQASIAGLLEPVVASTAAYLILGEALLPLQVLGGVLVLVSVVLTQTT
jgi:drug/metabolite transporter (DMT)-like permease